MLKTGKESIDSFGSFQPMVYPSSIFGTTLKVLHLHFTGRAKARRCGVERRGELHYFHDSLGFPFRLGRTAGRRATHGHGDVMAGVQIGQTKTENWCTQPSPDPFEQGIQKLKQHSTCLNREDGANRSSLWNHGGTAAFLVVQFLFGGLMFHWELNERLTKPFAWP